MKYRKTLLIIFFSTILLFQPVQVKAKVLSAEKPSQINAIQANTILYSTFKIYIYELDENNGAKLSHLCIYPDDIDKGTYGCGSEYPDQGIQDSDGSFYVGEKYYLQNVLPTEMNLVQIPPEPEALKAQVVASRTVASWKSANGPWDTGSGTLTMDLSAKPRINNSTDFQVFIPGAYNSSSSQSDIDTAFNGTQGEYLSAGDGHTIDTEFSSDMEGNSTDGGQTYLKLVQDPISTTCGAHNNGNLSGMSQLGAVRWAKGNVCPQGTGSDWSVKWDYRQILAHYYTGIDFMKEGSSNKVAPDNRWNLLYHTDPVLVGGNYVFDIQLQNTSTSDWKANYYDNKNVSIGYQWTAQGAKATGHWTNLMSIADDIPKGGPSELESFHLSVPVERGGKATLHLDLRWTNSNSNVDNSWFSNGQNGGWPDAEIDADLPDKEIVAFVIDDTGSMVDDIEQVKSNINDWVNQFVTGGVNPIYQLITYKDNVDPHIPESTWSADDIKSWVNDLSASGGVDCPEDMLGALDLTAQKAPGSKALVMSDAGFHGNSGNLALIISHLTAAGVKVNIISYGSCFDTDNGDVGPDSLIELASKTGGFFVQVGSSSETREAGSILLNEMITPSNLALYTDQVMSGSTKAYNVRIDPTATEANFMLNKLSGSMNLVLHRPDGTQVNQGDPDATFTVISNIQYVQIASPTTGLWQVQVVGNGEFAFSASGNTTIAFNYLSNIPLASDQEANLRVSLTGAVNSPVFTLVHADGTSPEAVSLFDDGLHGDDGPGDGIYGGTWTPTVGGEYYMHVDGTTSDDDTFERVATQSIEVLPRPTVLSSVRAFGYGELSVAASVYFTVTFSESVTGVDASDFTLTTTGVSGASISSISGSGRVYMVTVNTGSGNGTIRLNVVNDSTIVNLASQPLVNGYTDGQSYTIGKTLAVLSSVRTSVSPTSYYNLNYRVTFTRYVTGVDASDFTLTTTGVSGASISGVSGSGNVYTLTVNTGSGSGTIRLDLIDDDTIVDSVGNKLGGAGVGNGDFTTGEVYNIEKTVGSITVTKLQDTNDGLCNADCSLREAIASAAPGDTIAFNAGLSGETIRPESTLTLTRNLTIDGSALATSITVSGDTDSNGSGDVQVLMVNSGVTAVLNNLAITKGKSSSSGGGIYNNGILTITDSIISFNTATSDSGGGIFNGGTLTIIDSVISSNIAGGWGGGIINYYGTVTITDSTLSGNSATDAGGFYNNYGTLTVTGSTLSGNSATDIGGVGVSEFGILTITNTSVSGNSSGIAGGALFTDANHVLNITNSTFSDNSVGVAGGGIYSAYNGALDTITITNSTFSNNSAGSVGGGIYNYDGTLIIADSTFSGNSAPLVGGVINDTGAARLDYANTIIANSTSGGDCIANGTLGTNINNLVEDGSCSALLSGDPNLGPLADNGGPTQTMALLSFSRAIDAGDSATCTSTPVNNLDQRGVTRPKGTQCDIGAYEADPAAVPVVEIFTVTSPVASFNIPITDFTASDDVGVTGYMVTESATPPLAGAVEWSNTAPATYTVISEGTYTLYPWAKDAMGNVSPLFASPSSVSVNITTPTTTDTPTETSIPTATPSQTATEAPTATPASSVVMDEFGQTTLDLAWEWYVPTEGPTYNLENDPGQLQLTVPPDHDHWTDKDTAPQLRRADMGNGDWSIETHLEADEANLADPWLINLVLGFGRYDQQWLSVDDITHTVHVRRVGEDDTEIAGDIGLPVYLRIEKTGSEYTFKYKAAAEDPWTTLDTQSIETPVTYVGLQVLNSDSSSGDAVVDVDYFKLERNGYVTPTSTDTSTATTTPTETETPTETTTPAETATPTETPTSETPTPTPNPYGITSDDFESGSFSGWSSAQTDGGDLSVTSSAAIEGSYGMKATINDQNDLYVVDNHPQSESEYHVRFYFNPNSVNIPNEESFDIFQTKDASNAEVFQISLRSLDGTYQIQASTQDNNAQTLQTGWLSITSELHAIQVEWVAASAPGANDGDLKIWVDNQGVAQIYNLDNDTVRIGHAFLGVMSPSSSDISGSVYFDDFISRRSGFIDYNHNILLGKLLVDGFESNDFSGWSSAQTDGGDLNVTSSAAIEGSHGMQATINDQNDLYVTDGHPEEEPVYNARFYFDPNSVAIPANSYFDILKGGGDEGAVFDLRFGKVNGDYALKLILVNYDETTAESDWVPISNQIHEIEMHWIKAWGDGGPEGDGRMYLWVDNSPRIAIFDQPNGTKHISSVQFGVLSPSSANISGVIHLDDFASSRLVDWYIGQDPRVTLPDYSQISTDAFESGSFSGWSSAVTDSGNLNVSSAAAIEGNYGMQATVDSQNEMYVRDDQPLNETHYDARFYFNPNSVVIPIGEQLGLFRAADFATGNALQVGLKNTEDGYQMQAVVYDNSGSPQESSWYPVTEDVHMVEVEWWAASAPDAGNGYLSLRLDDGMMEELTGINNDARRVDYTEMGVLSPSSADITGTLYFDDFSSNRVGHIGPDQNVSLMMEPKLQAQGQRGPQIERPETNQTPIISRYVTATSSRTPTATATPSRTATSTPTSSAVPTSTSTNTLVPTSAPTNTAVPTATAEPSRTSTPIADTATPVDTSSPMPTNTTTPSLTPTPTPTETETPHSGFVPGDRISDLNFALARYYQPRVPHEVISILLQETMGQTIDYLYDPLGGLTAANNST